MKRFGEEAEQAIDEVRALARGVYPALLASSGLCPALVSASRCAAAPVSVSARGIRRCRPEVENAVYFTCLAAIDNAAKHAGPAQISVDARDTADALHFTVCDTGCGFSPDRTSSGAGMTNMRDRIAALGGTLSVDSGPSRGTRLHCSVPDPWLRAAARRRSPTSWASSMGSSPGLVDEEAANLARVTGQADERSSQGCYSRALRPERS